MPDLGRVGEIALAIAGGGFGTEVIRRLLPDRAKRDEIEDARLQRSESEVWKLIAQYERRLDACEKENSLLRSQQFALMRDLALLSGKLALLGQKIEQGELSFEIAKGPEWQQSNHSN